MKSVSIVGLFFIVLLVGCGSESGIVGPPGPPGPSGAQGPTGATGIAGPAGVGGPTGGTGPAGTNGTNNRFVSGVFCLGTVSGLSGAPGTALNSLLIKYKAYVTTAGDVFAVASISSGSLSIGDTSFYSASQVGASTGVVLFVDDFATPNGGFWDISADRTTLVATAVYTDNSLGADSPVTLTFSGCTVFTF